MNIHVHQLRVDVDEQEGHGEFSPHQGRVITLQERVVDALALNGALIHKEMLLAAIGAADARLADETADTHLTTRQLDGKKFLDELRAVKFPEPAPQIVGRREVEDFTAVDDELEGDV